jgi:hypothetical protein
MGRDEDDADARAGAVEAARTRAESAGKIFVVASEQLERVCECGKHLDFNLQHHPRVPQSKELQIRRQTGLIPFPTTPPKS